MKSWGDERKPIMGITYPMYYYGPYQGMRTVEYSGIHLAPTDRIGSIPVTWGLMANNRVRSTLLFSIQLPHVLLIVTHEPPSTLNPKP